MKNYRSYLLAGAAALSLGFVSAAQAADPIIYEQPPVMSPAAMYDWSGFYAGVTGAYNTGDVDFAPPTGITPFGFDIDGWSIGGVAGYNFQSGPWVYGIEGDLLWTRGIEGSATLAPVTGSAESEGRWMGSVRGRVGYAFDNILPYVTGGVAFANNRGTVNLPGTTLTDTQTHIGWTAGAGVEVGITQQLSGSLEYRYTDFGSETYDYAPGLSVPGDGNLHTVGASLKWRFN